MEASCVTCIPLHCDAVPYAGVQVCLLILQRSRLTHSRPANHVSLEDLATRDPFLAWQRHKVAREDMQDDGFSRFRAANRQGALLQQMRKESGKVHAAAYDTSISSLTLLIPMQKIGMPINHMCACLLDCDAS